VRFQEIVQRAEAAGGDQRPDKCLQFIRDGAYRIKGRLLVEMEDLAYSHAF
jgi:hypothetical protein